MSILNCPECNRRVSDKAIECPHCGYPLAQGDFSEEDITLKNASNKKKRGVTIALSLILIICTFGALGYFVTTIHSNDDSINPSDTISIEEKVHITPQLTEAVHKYKSIREFSEGLAVVANDNYLWGFMNFYGEEVIPCIYEGMEIGKFSEGLACVPDSEVEDGIKFIDKNGKTIISGYYIPSYIIEAQSMIGSPYYAQLTLPNFEDGICEVGIKENGTITTKYINVKGEITSNPKEVKAHNIPNTVNGETNQNGFVAYVETDGEYEKMGYKDKDGNIVIPAKYSWIGSFDNGLAYATITANDPSVMGSFSTTLSICGFVDINGNDTFTTDDFVALGFEKSRIEQKNREYEKQEEERLEREKEEGEINAFLNWAEGTWEYRGTYSTAVVVISGNHIYNAFDGEVNYNGVYEIYDGAMHFGNNYIPIDYNRNLLMVDNNTSFTKISNSKIPPQKEEKTSFSNDASVWAYMQKMRWENIDGYKIYLTSGGVSINGVEAMCYTPRIIRLSKDYAEIKVELINPRGVLVFNVYPQKNLMIDKDGNRFIGANKYR